MGTRSTASLAKHRLGSCADALRERVQARHASSHFTLRPLYLHFPTHWTPPYAEFHLDELGQSWADSGKSTPDLGFSLSFSSARPNPHTYVSPAEIITSTPAMLRGDRESPCCELRRLLKEASVAPAGRASHLPPTLPRCHRLHAANAVHYGASVDELVATVAIAAAQGAKTIEVGVPILWRLLEERGRSALPQRRR